MVGYELAPYLLPMAFLLGVVSTYGRLAAERELVAIRMAGIHPAAPGPPGTRDRRRALALDRSPALERLARIEVQPAQHACAAAEKDALRNVILTRSQFEFGDSFFAGQPDGKGNFDNPLLVLRTGSEESADENGDGEDERFEATLIASKAALSIDGDDFVLALRERSSWARTSAFRTSRRSTASPGRALRVQAQGTRTRPSSCRPRSCARGLRPELWRPRRATTSCSRFTTVTRSRLPTCCSC